MFSPAVVKRQWKEFEKVSKHPIKTMKTALDRRKYRTTSSEKRALVVRRLLSCPPTLWTCAASAPVFRNRSCCIHRFL